MVSGKSPQYLTIAIDEGSIMYCSSRCLRSTPKRCHRDRLQVCLLFDGEFVEFLAESRRREPLLSGRVQHDFWGENSNDDPFAFPT